MPPPHSPTRCPTGPRDPDRWKGGRKSEGFGPNEEVLFCNESLKKPQDGFGFEGRVYIYIYCCFSMYK